tara:strand:+ start:1796 stop:2569 length:774 start_codon:yes stop_codon:yes gene_type:complete
MTVKIGSLFSGIGGFELGLERAIPGAETVWQCEQNDFCQKVLKKHWPGATIYDDVRNINETVEPIDILCGGFPCQSISVAGKMKGLSDENKSGLWWEMFRIISILRPKIICLENVSNILKVGGCEVIGSLTEIGYSTEWTIISASDFGAPHKRSRWFCVGWTTHPHSGCIKKHTSRDITVEKEKQSSSVTCKDTRPGPNYWQKFPTESPFCGRNDGLPHRLDRIRALGNAIVPQCSEWVGRQIVKSGLLNDLIGGEV